MTNQYLAILFCIPLFGNSQPNLPVEPFFQTIVAKKVIKNTNTFHLSGTVKQVTETRRVTHFPENENMYDTVSISRYQFVGDGLLTRFSKGDSLAELKNSGAHYEVYAFDPITRQLASLTVYDGQVQYSLILSKLFNKQGYIASERYFSLAQEDDSIFHHRVQYIYNATHTGVSVRIRYDKESDRYQRRNNEKWAFKFDGRGHLIGESMKEQDFSSSMTISYHPAWQLPVQLFYRQACATENSCLNVYKSLAYDKKGNILVEALSDFTIRNALWSYSYCHLFTYNNKNDVIEKRNCMVNDKPHIQLPGINSPKPKPPKPAGGDYTVYEYKYDAMGNWVERKEFTVNEKKERVLVSVTERELEYY
jgi:hypothetical protein